MEILLKIMTDSKVVGCLVSFMPLMTARKLDIALNH